MTAKLRGPISVTRLARLMAAERTTVTRNLTVLEKKGLITIEAGSDRRERQVRLTPEGEEALLKSIPFWQEAQDRISKELGEDRMAAFRKDLAEIASLARS
jgi:DNA-binding MarR family transcriptional regulator